MAAKKRKTILTVLLVIFYVVTAAVLYFAVFRAGMLVVEIEESRPGGDRVHVRVPAVLAQTALRWVPDRVFAEHAADVEQWIPAVRAASAEIPHSPDGILFEMHSPGQDVSIVKKGRILQVDVRSPEERVHLALPVSMIEPVLSRFEGARQTSTSDPTPAARAFS